ncbi:hypothetical protein CFAM422_008441 [Trichoderma lentiforme]|uniref:Uncharacterized protein n=1 Tax=Trichoderma lentiforme TaxID=1567552 RepID=A0A9P4XCJ9_9HYPO|nr:hypothetical protein CFAM422_008441 [Trichoderma lentiforme]
MDSTLDVSDHAILTEVTAFLAQVTAYQKKQLCQFLQEQPRHVPLDSLLSEKELPIKLELIGELRRRLHEDFGTSRKPFHFSNIQLAALSLMSVETLQDLRQDTISVMRASTPHYQLPFLFHGEFPSGTDAFAPMVNHDTRKISHLNNEQEKCFLRDQRRCVLTKATAVEPCYIAPVGLAGIYIDMDVFTDSTFLSQLLGDVWVQISRIMATDYPGAFKYSWNMLCLHPTLCRYWAQCLFGLKYLEMTANDDGSTVVQFQFHWMPINGIKSCKRVEPPYDDAIDAMLQTTTTDVPRYWYCNYHLKSGDSFSVAVNSKEEAVKMKAALELQWVAVRLAALSGISKEWGCEGIRPRRY